MLRAYEAIKAAWEPRVTEGGVAASRAFADTVFASFRGADLDLRPERVIDLELPGGDENCSAKLYRPNRANGGDLGAVLFLHGGGWILGGIAAYEGQAAALGAGID